MITYDFLFKSIYRALKRRAFRHTWHLMNVKIVWSTHIGDIINKGRNE